MVINVAELSLDELVSFCRWLLDEGHMPNDADNILYFFEKPHKWDAEYDEYAKVLEKEKANA